MKAARSYCLPVILFMGMIACSDPDDPGVDEDLMGVVWKVDSLQTLAETNVPGPGRRTTIKFLEDMVLRVDGPCNSYTGSYELGPGNTLGITLIDSSNESCDYSDWVQDLEDAIVYALEQITGYMQEENRLTVYTSRRDVVLDFSIEITDETLLDLIWQLDSLQTPTDKIVPASTWPVTLEFRENGKAGGKGPCNQYSVHYELGRNNGLTIVFGISTEKACSDQRIEADKLFFQAVEEIEAYEVDSERVVLYDNEHQYVFSFSIGVLDEDLLDVIWKIDSLKTPDGEIVVGPDTVMTIQFFKNRGLDAVTDWEGREGFYFITAGGSITINYGHGSSWGTRTTDREYFLRTSFFSGLENVSAYDMGVNTLTLYNSNRTYVLSFSIE